MPGHQGVLLLLSLWAVWAVSGQPGCDQFQPVNCVLNEDNIVGHARENDTQNCQDRCIVTADCGNFTHFEDQCFLLQSCLITEDCPDCISGPTSPSFSSCPWPPSPTTTTTTTTTVGGECEEYIVDMQCDLDEYNVIQTFHSPSIAECHNQCRGLQECLWFTWYRDDSQELPSLCLLLAHCDSLERCDGCISGPRDGQDVEECFGEETTRTTVAPPSTSVRTTEVTTTGECGMYHSAACDITEYNTLEVRHNLGPAQCQEACLLTAECHVFTWHPSIANTGVCFLLTECNSFQTCPYCISGPESGGDIESCYDFTSPPPTTTTTMSSSVSPPSTTSSGDECDQFVRATCDIDDSNTLDLMHDVLVGQCQDICLYSSLCHWFTWYNVSGMRGTCWFLDHCQSQEPCPDCISGPAPGTDVDNCL